MSLNNILANNIKNLRIQSGLSQKEAAEKLGVSGSYLGYLERGQRNPGIGLIEKVAQLFKVEPYTLLIDENLNTSPILKYKIDKVISYGPIHQQFIIAILDAYTRVLESK